MASQFSTQVRGVRRGAPRRGLVSVFSHMMALRRQRRALAKLEDHMLNDIGVSRREANAEAARPVWDSPQYWKK